MEVSDEKNKGKLDETETCQMESSDAISAFHRAKTEECKQEIKRVACLAQNGNLYEKDVERTCPLNPADVGVQDHEAPHGVPDHAKAPAEDIRIVFVFVVHGRAFRQFRRLFKAVYHRRHYIYIHVDSRSDHLKRKITGMIIDLPNVAMAPWSLPSIWGGASLLQVLLRCMEDLIKKSEWHWDFFINLSETDYPIKSIEVLVSYLNKNRDKNFLKPHGGNALKFIKKQGLDRTFVECENRMWRIGNREVPQGIQVDGGSDWICLNRDFSEYLVSSDDKLLKAMKQMYAYSLLPAESFFHTMLRNGPKCQSFLRNNLRLTNWNRKLGCRCQYRHIVDWCGCSPNDFKPEDLPRLQSSGDRYFARKFEAVVNQEIVNNLDAWLFGPYPDNTPGLHTYFESIYDIEDTLSQPTDSQLSIWMSFMRISAAHHLSLRLSSAGGGVDSGNDRLHPSFGCTFDPTGLPTEASVYTEHDELQGLIVTFKVQQSHRGDNVELGGGSVTVQTWFEMFAKRTTYVKLKGPAARLTFLEVHNCT
jgi:protein xylosyltransferase